jgi:hypothetical protein
MDATLNERTEVDPKTVVVAIYSATEAEIKRRIVKYAKVVPDCSNKDGIAFAKEARAAFKEPRLLVEEIRAEKKKPYLEIGRLIDSEAKRITALVAPHEKTWDDAIKTDETRKENERREKAFAEIRRVDAIRSKISAMEHAPLDAMTMSPADIRTEINRISGLVIDELYAEFEEEAKLKKSAALAQLAQVYTLREMMVAQQAAQPSQPAQEEQPKPEAEKYVAAVAQKTEVTMLELARRDAQAFRTAYAGLEELSFVMDEIDSFMITTAQRETAKA